MLIQTRHANNHHARQVIGLAKGFALGFLEHAILDHLAQELTENTAILPLNAKLTRKGFIIKPIWLPTNGF
jgi:hypothetical protein